MQPDGSYLSARGMGARPGHSAQAALMARYGMHNAKAGEN
jgi:hypothetical protein